MSKFSWDDHPGYSTVAMNANGSVYAFSGDIQYDFDEEVWFPLNPARNMLHVFSPASEVYQGLVLPRERPDLPPDWWFEDESGEGQTTDDERFEQLDSQQYIGAPGVEYIQEGWTVNTTFPQDSPTELARQAIWSHFEEFECLPDFLVGDTEVLGDYFMGIKVIDDEA